MHTVEDLHVQMGREEYELQRQIECLAIANRYREQYADGEIPAKQLNVLQSILGDELQPSVESMIEDIWVKIREIIKRIIATIKTYWTKLQRSYAFRNQQLRMMRKSISSRREELSAVISFQTYGLPTPEVFFNLMQSVQMANREYRNISDTLENLSFDKSTLADVVKQFGITIEDTYAMTRGEISTVGDTPEEVVAVTPGILSKVRQISIVPDSEKDVSSKGWNIPALENAIIRIITANTSTATVKRIRLLERLNTLQIDGMQPQQMLNAINTVKLIFAIQDRYLALLNQAVSDTAKYLLTGKY